MELIELSDDALLSVLHFVPPKDLFTCRLVCKKLAVLALHWDAWSRRDVQIEYLDGRLAGVLLHLAPCLQRASVNERDVLALSRSKCAVADLTLLVGLEDDPVIAVRYAEAVRNQKALGRLRRLHLILEEDYDYYDEDAVKELAKAVAFCAPAELEIEGNSLFTARPVTSGPPKPSLKKLRCGVVDENLPFVNSLLAVHGATLEEVVLSVEEGCDSDTIPCLLGAMPQLSSLDCTAMPGLQAVAACTMLKKLHLRVGATSTPTTVQDAAKLLCQAKLLHEVHIEMNARPGIAEKLINALSSSASRHIVEQLELTLFGYKEMTALLLLPLPALRSLKLTELRADVDNNRFVVVDKHKTPADALDQLLLALTPETAPALRTLEVSLSNFACAHAWFHRAAVSKALAMNPLLHLLLTGFFFHCNECNECAVAHCHKEVEESVWKVCLFSHDSRKCTSPYHSYEAGRLCQWIQIGPRSKRP